MFAVIDDVGSATKYSQVINRRLNAVIPGFKRITLLSLTVKEVGDWFSIYVLVVSVLAQKEKGKWK